MKAVIKALFLYTTPANYFSRCLMHLSTQSRFEIHIVYQTNNHILSSIPFNKHPIACSIKPQHFKELLFQCLHFDPTIIFISGWIDKEYLRIGRIFHNRGIPIIGLSDTPLKNNLRQYLGKWYAKWFLKNIFSAFWVSGKKAENLIRYLGWSNHLVFQGLYVADHQIYFPSTLQFKQPSFLFVGRLEKIKGVETLIAAYQWYRSTVRNPWILKIAGTGSLHGKLPNSEGIQYLGYLDNTQLALEYNQSTCFILPSLHEPWGVVIHEAASVGLPMILSNKCGANELFLEPNFNGWIWPNRNFKTLGALMTKVHFTSQPTLKRFGKRSCELSLGINIQKWLKTFATIKSLQ